jgi:pimeloyl-ACP methyl ester carboxylesterase
MDVRMAFFAVAAATLAAVISAHAAVPTERVHYTPNVRAASMKTVRADVMHAKYRNSPMTFRDELGTIVAYPPARSLATVSPTVLYLHGIHGRPDPGCAVMREGATEVGWLLCPSGNVREAGDTYSWSGAPSTKHAFIQRAFRAVAPDEAPSPNILVGFSQGAYAAAEMVRARLGPYRGILLIGASVDIDAEMLAAASVKRIVLAAGELDAAFAPMQRTASRLEQANVRVRFVNLGRVGHTYETSNRTALREALLWVARDVDETNDTPRDETLATHP